MTPPDDDVRCRHYASPPCMAHEVDPAHFDPFAVDPEQACDVARWREAERARLRAARLALRGDARAAVERDLILYRRPLLEDRMGSGQGPILASYWPVEDEPDLRPLMAELDVAGVAPRFAGGRNPGRAARLPALDTKDEDDPGQSEHPHTAARGARCHAPGSRSCHCWAGTRRATGSARARGISTEPWRRFPPAADDRNWLRCRPASDHLSAAA